MISFVNENKEFMPKSAFHFPVAYSHTGLCFCVQFSQWSLLKTNFPYHWLYIGDSHSQGSQDHSGLHFIELIRALQAFPLLGVMEVIKKGQCMLLSRRESISL